MLGFRYKKAPPTVFTLHFQNGKAWHSGPGLSFWYFAPISTIVDVPLSSHDVPFVFRETTADFQEVTVQGQLTYRVSEPARAALLLDFSVEPGGEYRGPEDPEDLLAQRLINTTQVITRGLTATMPLARVLSSSDIIVESVIDRLKTSETILMLGVEVIGLSILAIKPTPEIARALEAASREAMQRQADQAIYLRRNAAVEEERRIKETELNTELTVESKRREIDEAKMSAEIALENQRAELMDRRVENERKEADSRAYALSSTLKPLENVDWRMLMAVSARGSDPRFAIALAFQQMAENAGKIGQLNVTPDLLNSLMTHSKDR